jgi:phosphate-selective porin OprO and OprP
MNWISQVILLAALGVGLSASRAMAQPAADPQSLQEVRARLEQQDRQIQQLQAQLQRIQQAPAATPTALAPAVASPANPAAVPAPPADSAPAQQPPAVYEVGSDTSIKASFKDGLFPWFETPNKDFTLHISCWIQGDNVWWGESPALKTSPTLSGGKVVYADGGQGVASGAPLGGIGDLQNGCYFRRIRPNFEGTFWETGEYRIIPALENVQFNAVGIDEMWVGQSKIPFVGTVRVGHVKTPMGLEGDMNTSSRAMTFMERSSYSESIELNQNFVTGLWLSNTYLDDRATATFAIFRPDYKSSSGIFYGDGQWGWQGRLTALPLYQDEGRHLLHVGLSGGWRSGTNNIATSHLHTFELGARPELRDDDPAAGGPGVTTNADSFRMVDTGVIAADHEFLMGLECLYIRGPLSFQAEYGWNWIGGAVGTLNPVPGLVLFPAGTPAQNYVFNGGYAQLAYTLTGENRSYDRRMGCLGREYYGKRGPFSNFFVVRDDAGNIISSWGTWEVALRYSYVDLNDGSGATRIQGGIMDGFSLALNWYLNKNLSVMFDWVYDHREDVPTAAVAGAGSTIPGNTSGFGTEVQFQF